MPVTVTSKSENPLPYPLIAEVKRHREPCERVGAWPSGCWSPKASLTPIPGQKVPASPPKTQKTFPLTNYHQGRLQTLLLVAIRSVWHPSTDGDHLPAAGARDTAGTQLLLPSQEPLGVVSMGGNTSFGAAV